MRDLTQGPVRNHVLVMALPIAAGMVFQTLYYFVDLYFVAQLGDAAIAGVSLAGNVAFAVLAMTQTLGIGTVALVSHSVGRKEQAEANLIFNQSVLLSVLFGAATLIAGYLLTDVFTRAVAADAESARQGAIYLYWFLPGLALQFALVTMGSALRGTGIVKPTMLTQILTVVLNTVLAPVFIGGWLTGHPMGAMGAGLASTISIAAGVVVLAIYFMRLEHYVGVHRELFMPRLHYWKEILRIGLPGGAELGLIFVFTSIIYWMIQPFGAAAQAGYGIGSRVMQGLFLPVMAVAFAAAPVAGQNFGARQFPRIRETFRTAAILGGSVMTMLTLFCQWRPDLLIAAFTSEREVIEMGALFLQIISWNFIAVGFIFTCSSLFQGLGNTWPSLVSSGSRLVTFLIPALWLIRQPWFELRHLWYLSVATVALQALTSYLLLRREFHRRLPTNEALVAST